MSPLIISPTFFFFFFCLLRPLYSNPPVHGARIVTEVLSDPALKQQWLQDLNTMASRLRSVRVGLVERLQKLGSKRSWVHIAQQTGMFAFSGLNKEEVLALRNEHVYMNLDGRMSVSGINVHNLDYLAESILKVTK